MGIIINRLLFVFCGISLVILLVSGCFIFLKSSIEPQTFEIHIEARSLYSEQLKINANDCDYNSEYWTFFIPNTDSIPITFEWPNGTVFSNTIICLRNNPKSIKKIKYLYCSNPIKDIPLNKDTVNNVILVINKNGKDKFIRERKMNLHFKWNDRPGGISFWELSSSSKDISSNRIELSSNNYPTFCLTLEIHPSEKGDTLLKGIIHNMTVESLKRIKTLIDNSKIGAAWDSLEKVSEKCENYTEFLPGIRQLISQEWCIMANSNSKIKRKALAYKMALDYDNNNESAKKMLNLTKIKLEQEINYAAQKARIVKAVFVAKCNDLSPDHEYIVKNVPRKYWKKYPELVEIVKYEGDVFIPTYNFLLDLVHIYEDVFGNKALKDFVGDYRLSDTITP